MLIVGEKSGHVSTVSEWVAKRMHEGVDAAAVAGILAKAIESGATAVRLDEHHGLRWGGAVHIQIMRRGNGAVQRSRQQGTHSVSPFSCM